MLSRREAKPSPGRKEKAFFVRPAVQQRPGHSLDGGFGHGSLPSEIDDSCDATHEIIVLVRNSQDPLIVISAVFRLMSSPDFCPE